MLVSHASRSLNAHASALQGCVSPVAVILAALCYPNDERYALNGMGLDKQDTQSHNAYASALKGMLFTLPVIEGVILHLSPRTHVSPGSWEETSTGFVARSKVEVRRIRVGIQRICVLVPIFSY